MSDANWVLKGIDPEARARAVEEAERLGISLADYLTDVVLHNALSEQVAAIAAETGAPAAPATEPSDFGVRPRFRALERRLEASVASLDSAVHTLDSSLVDVTARLGEAENLAGDTAHALQQGLQETATQLAALRLHITDVEENSCARDDEAAERHAGLAHAVAGLSYGLDEVARRTGEVETVAHRADSNAAILADAHEALKHAIADDFSSFTQQVTDQVGQGLREVAAAADAAAAQADAAVAHLVVELRGVRQSLEQSVAEGVDETRRRVHAAFSEAGERIESLSERLDSVERLSLRANEQLRIQLTDMEDAAQTALEETAESLRQAGAALAADLQRSVRDGKAALESVHEDLSNEISDLRERQVGGLARLKQLDAGLAAVTGDVAGLRASMLQRIADSENAAADRIAGTEAQLTKYVAGADADWNARFDALTARLSAQEEQATEANFAQRAETERVEACTLAALEKLAGDIAEGDKAVAAQMGERFDAANALLEGLRQRVDANQTSVEARLKVIDLALGAQGALAERIAHLETGVAFDDLIQRVADLGAQLGAQDRTLAESAERTQEMARAIGRVGAQSAEVAAQADDRLHKMELAISDLRLERLQHAPSADAELVKTLETRVAELEERQAEALHSLRNDIARFVTENMQRLEALENSPALEHAYDVAAEFKTLRQRIEERILGVEQRSVRALEQVADTMAVLERRFNEGPEGALRSA